MPDVPLVPGLLPTGTSESIDSARRFFIDDPEDIHRLPEIPLNIAQDRTGLPTTWDAAKVAHFRRATHGLHQRIVEFLVESDFVPSSNARKLFLRPSELIVHGFGIPDLKVLVNGYILAAGQVDKMPECDAALVDACNKINSDVYQLKTVIMFCDRDRHHAYYTALRADVQRCRGALDIFIPSRATIRYPTLADLGQKDKIFDQFFSRLDRFINAPFDSRLNVGLYLVLPLFWSDVYKHITMMMVNLDRVA